MEPIEQRLRTFATNAEPRIVELRRRFHMQPELSWKEHRTTAAIVAELERMGLEVERPLDTGCVATLHGTAPDAYLPDGSPRRRILLRADIDALAVTERTGAPYASRNHGVMHACGHDAHIAMLLGALEILLQATDELHGEVRAVFQPSEENGQGARAMIEAGVLDGADGAYAAHIWSEVDAGSVSIEPGPRMASVDWFRIDVEGSSCHGAMPERGADAAVAAAAITCELQTVVSRRCPALEPVVVTVGELHAGSARNVVAGHAYLAGTVRTFDEKTHTRIPRLMEDIARDVAAAHGCRAELAEYAVSHGPVVNDERCAIRCARSAEKALGADALVRYPGTLSGEDFAEYQARVPGVLAFLGTRNEEAGIVHPQHSCFYDIDESVLAPGALLAAQYAVDFLAEK